MKGFIFTWPDALMLIVLAVIILMGIAIQIWEKRQINCSNCKWHDPHSWRGKFWTSRCVHKDQYDMDTQYDQVCGLWETRWAQKKKGGKTK